MIDQEIFRRLLKQILDAMSINVYLPWDVMYSAWALYVLYEQDLDIGVDGDARVTHGSDIVTEELGENVAYLTDPPAPGVEYDTWEYMEDWIATNFT